MGQSSELDGASPLRIATLALTVCDKHVNEKILDMYYESKFPARVAASTSLYSEIPRGSYCGSFRALTLLLFSPESLNHVYPLNQK
ncbi:unnamed protein product [Lasius platythorax]|uniref:Uncharacterized protein n=1 Tax=Lasius platythorax TaxID=488582 RepID=A0AAV2NQI1_9HYME